METGEREGRKRMASSFVPKDREELLLRTPLTFGFSAPTDMYQPRNSPRDVRKTHFFTAAPHSALAISTQCFISCMQASGSEFREDASRERQRAKMKKMSRNNPHTGTSSHSQQCSVAQLTNARLLAPLLAPLLARLLARLSESTCLVLPGLLDDDVVEGRHEGDFLIVRRSATKDVVSHTYYFTKGNNIITTNDPHDKAHFSMF